MPVVAFGVENERMPIGKTTLMLPDPPLSDHEIVLRAWESTDAEAVLAAGTDPMVSRFRYSLPKSIEGACEWVDRIARDRVAGVRLELAITERGAALGSVSVFELEHGNAMVGYWLLPDGRGRGFAVRAVRMLAGWAFTTLGIGRLVVLIEPENVASAAVVERCGFVREGRLRRHLEGREGRVDALIYGLLPEELAS